MSVKRKVAVAESAGRPAVECAFALPGAIVTADMRRNRVYAGNPARDVTERQLLDRELRETNIALEGAKSAAEKANLAKTDVLSSMSHELRSPLAALKLRKPSDGGH